jgi:asparagine synthase (glutamine-hydrolysing)
MCGITGWVAFDRDLTREQATLDEMTETMACRGPDDRGTWTARHAALGHRRLAVIDIEGGTQPMTLEVGDATLAMVYSGEAYNYTELRDELRGRGHHFRTDSDTEVVLHGYLEWGPALAERLNGMYAFAIWDSRTETLVMIRDRMGIKPFYYYPTPGGVLFGSEPKAILANPAARRVVGLDGLREMFNPLTKTPGHAGWEGMHEVVPGTIVTAGTNGIRRDTYWTLRATPHTDNQNDTVATVRALLDDIVRRQLVADVPRCVLLSGGLDSSVLTGLAAGQLRAHGETVRSFAVDFVGQSENFTANDLRPTQDTPYVHEVAEYVSSRHSDIVLDHNTLADPDIRRIVTAARDMPGMGDIDASLYLLFKSIREHSTVALSGESADEVFGGYAWFHDPAVQRAKTFPWLAMRGTSMTGGQENQLVEPSLLSAMDIPGYLADSYQAAVAEVDPLPGEDEHEARMRVICHLHLTRFVRMLLDRKDRMSMAVGLEVRVPFCDHRLVEYVYNTPWALKTYDGREKSLLRGAARDVLPASVAERVKSPYPQTQDPQYPMALQQQAKELLTGTDSPVFALINRDWLVDAVAADAGQVTMAVRFGLERTLNLATWLDIYRPEVRTS